MTQHPSTDPYAGYHQSIASAVPSREVGETSVEGLSPFLNIWTRPRRTIRAIIAQDPSLHVVFLACLYGIAQVLDRASSRNAGDALSIPAIFAIAVIGGPLMGLLTIWIFSYAVRITGGWIGGRADDTQVRAAVIWGLVPTVSALLLWVPYLAVIGREMFTSEAPRMTAQPAHAAVLLVLMMVELVLWVWSIVLMCNTVAEVQGFQSAWKGLGNVLLAGVIMLVTLLAVVFATMLTMTAIAAGTR